MPTIAQFIAFVQQAGMYLRANQMQERFANLIDGVVEHNVSAGSTTLTAASPQLQYGTIKLTGAPAGAFEYRFPDGYTGTRRIINATGQSVTVKTVSGTGIVAAAGAMASVTSDGTNISSTAGGLEAHGHSGVSADGGALGLPLFTVQGGDPSSPTAGYFKVYVKADGVYARDSAGNIYDFQTSAQVTAAINAVIDSAPGALDTLNELAAALGDDANFATTVTNALAAKAPLHNPEFTGAPYLAELMAHATTPPTGQARIYAKSHAGSVRVFAINESGKVFDLTKGLVSQSSRTANYTLTSDDDEILANASGGAFTVTLPTAAGIAGKVFFIKKTDSSDNIVTIATTSGQAIDGRSGRKLATQYSYTRVVSDGANWIETDAETPGMVKLTDAATIAVDCLVFPRRGGKAKITLGGNRTLGEATGMVDGMVLWVQWKQDATGSRTITHHSQYMGSTDVPLITLTTGAANVVDESAYKYDAAAAKWRVAANNKGFAS